MFASIFNLLTAVHWACS